MLVGKHGSKWKQFWCFVLVSASPLLNPSYAPEGAALFLVYLQVSLAAPGPTWLRRCSHATSHQPCIHERSVVSRKVSTTEKLSDTLWQLHCFFNWDILKVLLQAKSCKCSSFTGNSKIGLDHWSERLDWTTGLCGKDIITLQHSHLGLWNQTWHFLV